MIKLIIFLVIIWQIRTILKKVSEAATKSGTDKPVGKSPGWQDRLRDMADKIRTEVEAAQQREREKAAPPIPAPAKPSGPRQEQAPAASRKTAQRPTAMPSRVAAPPAPEADEWEKPRVDSPGATDAVCAPSRKMRQHQHACAYRMPNLKKAVVWSEIIAPPLALRDENHPLSRIGK